MKKAAGFVASVLLLLFVCCSCAAPRNYSSLSEAEADGARLGEHITVDGVDVSGCTPSEASALLLAHHASAQQDLHYTVKAGDDSITLPASLLPFARNTEEVLLAALQLPPHQPARNGERTFTSKLSLNREQLRLVLEPVAEALAIEPRDASVTYDADAGCFCYTDECTGRKVDVVSLAEKVYAGTMNVTDTSDASNVIEASAEELQPAYTRAMAEADTVLLAEFSTSFSGSTYGKAGRVHNIQKAASHINGVTLEPGEVFDMNAVLGPRSGETGWKEATAIRDGVYTQEFGGGVCQVSSTLYNAVLMADLAVTERHHHSWPLGYVDIGRDATISTGGPNFRFENSTDAPITVTSSTDAEEKTVTVRIFGRSPGYTVRLTSEKVESLPDPGDELLLDEALPFNTRREERPSRAGSVSVTYKEYYDAEGNYLRREEVSRDKYRPVTGLVYVSSDLYYGAVFATDVWPIN